MDWGDGLGMGRGAKMRSKNLAAWIESATAVGLSDGGTTKTTKTTSTTTHEFLGKGGEHKKWGAGREKTDGNIKKKCQIHGIGILLFSKMKKKMNEDRNVSLIKVTFIILCTCKSF